AWRAAADEDRLYGAPLQIGQVLLEVAQQRGDIFVLRQFTVALVRIEVAVGTLAYAPGHMDVQAQGRQRKERVPVVTDHGSDLLSVSQWASSWRSAWPRWLIPFFTEGSSCAEAQPWVGTWNSGS